MDISLYSIIALIFSWIGFGFKFQFPFYWSSRPLIIFLKQIGFYFIIFGWLLIFYEGIILQLTVSLEILILILFPTIGAIFIRFFIFYGKNYPRLIPLAEIFRKLEKNRETKDEFLVISFDRTIHHIYPLLTLRTKDIVFLKPIEKKDIPNYSLTYCVLCNTTHAYILPVINGKEIEITSNNGSILNGNKILADRYGRYIWQQFTGEGLNKRTKDYPLRELSISRVKWVEIENSYHSGEIYIGHKSNLSSLFFAFLNWLIQKSQKFSFSLGKVNNRLKPKKLVIGVEIDGISKAYPLTMFSSPQMKLLQDKIGSVDISILYDNNSRRIFREKNLKLKINYLEKNEKKYTLDGKALGNYVDLQQVRFIDKAYWYMWSKFHPNTEVFNET